jgi:hypothetical protein
MKAKQLEKYLAVAFAAAALSAVGCRESNDGSSQTSVSAATEALASAVAACGQRLGECAQETAGDGDALSMCRDAFSACRQMAGAGALDGLTDAIQACTDGAGDCAKGARGPDAAECHDELVTCLGAKRPDAAARPERDGSAGGDSAAAVHACIDTLRACVEQDGSAKQCAVEVRACILAAMPAPDHAGMNDGGRPDLPDAAMGGNRPGDDAGMAGNPPRADAGMAGNPPGADAGMAGNPPGADAGMAGEAPGPSCKEMFDACIASGETRKACARLQRECAKP